MSRRRSPTPLTSVDLDREAWQSLGRRTFATVADLFGVAEPLGDGTHALAVRACNAAGECTPAAGAATALVRVRAAAPAAGDVRIVGKEDDGTAIAFLSKAGGLRGAWSGFHGAAAVEVCVGTTPTGCQAAAFAAVFASNASSGVWEAAVDLHLQCGESYHLAVRATDCAGQTTVVASDAPLSAARRPPTAAWPSAPTAARRRAMWRMARRSRCAGAASSRAPGCATSRLELVEVSGGAPLWSATPNVTTFGFGVSGEMAVPPAVVDALVHGAAYEVRVAATSHAGLTAEATTEFVVDATPPLSAPIVVAAEARGGDTRRQRSRWRSVRRGPALLMTAAAASPGTRCASAPTARPNPSAAPTSD